LAFEKRQKFMKSFTISYDRSLTMKFYKPEVTPEFKYKIFVE